MASEANQTLTQEVSAQRFRATESFEFLEKTARDQITRLRAERDLEINEARKAIASVDEAKGLEVALLRDQLSRQCQDTENLKQELRRPSELQEEIIAELMSLGAQRGNPRGTFPYAWIAKPTGRSGQVFQGSTFLHRMVPQNVTTLKRFKGSAQYIGSGFPRIPIMVPHLKCCRFHKVPHFGSSGCQKKYPRQLHIKV